MKIATTILISNNMTMFCGVNIYRNQLSSVWQGDDPFNYIFPVFIMQIAIACLFASAVKALLEPIGQTSFISQMIGGIMVGPSCFGHTGLFKDRIFPPNFMYIFDNCQYFGSMFFLFLTGVKTDLTMLQRSGKKAWLIGLTVPAGPPLGAATEDRLECFVKSILLPTFIISSTLQVNFIVFISFLGKLLGTVLPALYCRVPYQDALWVGLIMNVQGVLDIEFWVWALISERIYTCLVLSTVIVTGAISPSVKFLRTIKKCSKQNVEFRILACIYHKENVPTILNVLEASHPTRYGPICIYMLHFIQLQGRASPLIVTHKNKKQNEGTVSVNSFTAISPYTTMHDDICSAASERRTSLIILPFHHHPSFSSTFHLPTSIRKVNQNVLKTAPCSVGLLVDQGSSQRAQASNKNDKSPNLVAVIFLGGEDDREALAYGARMGDNSSVKLTVFRFSIRKENPDPAPNADMLDNDSIDDFKKYIVGHENVLYREEEVKDSVGIVKVITSIEHSFDLLILGKDHDQNSSDLLRGLEEWSEFPELGVVGDMLSSSNSNCNG
ncbi:hypothetical protein MKX01_007316 [Papaver californicum]|nr:hypothetical protein MKX01_007316 [Papaver californicum]